MAISTLARHYELVPDVTSPVLKEKTHALKLDRLPDGDNVLVKVHAAVFYNHVQAVERLQVEDMSAVRGLRLWHAKGPDHNALPLTEAMKPVQSRWNRPQTLVYSYARNCGTLVVSSCLNMAMDSERVTVPPLASVSLSAADVDFRDYHRPMEPGEPDELIGRHLERLEEMGINSQQALSPDFDLEMVKLLRSLPESSALA